MTPFYLLLGLGISALGVSFIVGKNDYGTLFYIFGASLSSFAIGVLVAGACR